MAGFPVVIAANGIGVPMSPVAQNAPVATIAENGIGTPIVISDLGAPVILEGYAPLEQMSVTFTQPGNLINVSDIVDAPSWFNTSSSFWIGEGDTALLMQYDAGNSRFFPFQGTITDTSGNRVLYQMFGEAMCAYTGSVPASYP